MSLLYILGTHLPKLAQTVKRITAKEKDATHPLASAQIQLVEDRVQVVTTDGHRLTVHTLPAPRKEINWPTWQAIVPQGKHEIGHVIVPQAEAQRLVKILRAAKADKTTDDVRINVIHEPALGWTPSTSPEIRVRHKLGATTIQVMGDTASEEFTKWPIGFDHEYLADALEAATSLCAGPVTVRFYNSGSTWALSPVRIESADKNTYTILMPVRI
jgi:DNA polymerase III sliding clamp (beta) subunit (PCNA family)